MVALPDISATIKAELDPMRSSMNEVQNIAKSTADQIAAEMSRPLFDGMQGQVEKSMQAMNADVKGAIQQTHAAVIDASTSAASQLHLYGPEQAERDIASARETLEAIKAQQAAMTGAGGGVLSDLNASFGRGSGAGMLARAFEGTGPLLAVGLITTEVKKATEETAKLSDEYRNGAIGADEFADHVAKSIPILGDIYSAGQSIREMITGEQAATDAVTEATKLQEQAMEAVTQQHKVLKDAMDETVHRAQDIAREIQKMGMSGVNLKLFDDDSKYLDKIHEIEDRFKEMSDSASEKTKKLIDDLITERNKLASSGTDAAKKRIAEIDDEVKHQREGLDVTLKQLQAQEQSQKTGAGQLDAAERARDVTESIDKANKESAKKAAEMLNPPDVQKMIEGAQKDLRRSTMTEEGKKLDDAKDMGASSGQLAELKKLLDQIQGIDTGKKVSEEINHVLDSLKSPVDRANEEVSQLVEWAKEGKITLAQFDSAAHAEYAKINKGQHEADGKGEKQDAKFADLIKPVSAQAMQLQFSAKFDKSQGNTADPQLAEQKKANDWLSQIYDRVNFDLQDADF